VRVTVIELPATWGDAPTALARVDALLASGAPSDLVLLPEQSLTGYVSPQGTFDTSPFAEPIDGPTARTLAGMARRHAVHLVAPLVLAENGGIYNAALGFAPDGSLLFTYRKRHPWIPEEWATPGWQAPPRLSIAGVTLTICICYDLHFLPVESADLLAEVDLLLFPSAWVDAHATRVPTLRKLARRFGVAIANANWGPGVVQIPGQGGSIILGPGGATLAAVVSGANSASKAAATIEPTSSQIPPIHS
jgi:predicted amidohydrolase